MLSPLHPCPYKRCEVYECSFLCLVEDSSSEGKDLPAVPPGYDWEGEYDPGSGEYEPGPGEYIPAPGDNSPEYDDQYSFYPPHLQPESIINGGTGFSRLSTISERTEKTEDSRWPSREGSLALNAHRLGPSSLSTSSYGQVLGLCCFLWKINIYLRYDSSTTNRGSLLKPFDQLLRPSSW